MAKGVYITSTTPEAGKTVFAVGLYGVLKEDMAKPGFFKPVGDPYSGDSEKRTDKDLDLIMEITERQFDRSVICPLLISPTGFFDEVDYSNIRKYYERIKNAYETIAEKSSVVLIEGNHHYRQFYSIGLDDLKIASLLKAGIILVSTCKHDGDIDLVLNTAECINNTGLKLLGVVFTNVNEIAGKRIDEKYRDILVNRNIPLLGIIPESRILGSPTIDEIITATGGTLLTEDSEEVRGKIIENFIIGAMQCNDALGYMRRSKNLGVITGGDRADIIITAAEVGVSVIILTGNLIPDSIALEKAKEKGIPVILVPGDTYTTAHNIQNIKTHIQPSELDLCKKFVAENVDWRKIA